MTTSHRASQHAILFDIAVGRDNIFSWLQTAWLGFSRKP
jgi:hypothetical protein